MSSDWVKHDRLQRVTSSWRSSRSTPRRPRSTRSAPRRRRGPGPDPCAATWRRPPRPTTTPPWRSRGCWDRTCNTPPATRTRSLRGPRRSAPLRGAGTSRSSRRTPHRRSRPGRPRRAFPRGAGTRSTCRAGRRRSCRSQCPFCTRSPAGWRPQRGGGGRCTSAAGGTAGSSPTPQRPRRSRSMRCRAPPRRRMQLELPPLSTTTESPRDRKYIGIGGIRQSPVDSFRAWRRCWHRSP